MEYNQYRLHSLLDDLTPEEFYREHRASIVENDYINGETIRIDGAIRMQPR